MQANPHVVICRRPRGNSGEKIELSEIEKLNILLVRKLPFHRYSPLADLGYQNLALRASMDVRDKGLGARVWTQVHSGLVSVNGASNRFLSSGIKKEIREKEPKIIEIIKG